MVEVVEVKVIMAIVEVLLSIPLLIDPLGPIGEDRVSSRSMEGAARTICSAASMMCCWLRKLSLSMTRVVDGETNVLSKAMKYVGELPRQP